VAGLPNEEIGNATGLYNLLRNIGGSIGIAVVNTIVIRHSQLHRNELAHSITATNPTFQGRLYGLQQYLMSHGASAVTAMERATALTDRTLGAQAALWSYVDDFRYMALVCFICIPITFLLRKAVGKRGISAGH
jgi:MFS transporter, DHA2 family, multidrug resistance protein